MNTENTQIEIVDLTETAQAADVAVELSDLELQAVSGGQRTTWTCGRPKQADEWTP